MIELFKDIPGYEGLYQVSNLGNVKSLSKPTGCCILKDAILSLPIDKRYGYIRIHLYDKTSRKSCAVHRLVAMAFIPNAENKPFINHKNGNRADNRIENLEWVTKSENELHKYRVLGYKNIRRRMVGQYDLSGELIKIWEYASHVTEGGFCRTSVGRVCRGITRSSGGYGWKYI